MGNGIIKILKFMWDCVLQVVYDGDDKCILCEKELYNCNYICADCEKRIKFCNDPFDIKFNNIKITSYSVSYYSGTMMELVLKLKYKSNFRAGETIANYMIDLVKRKKLKFDFIAYIPMTKNAIKKRGYNQSRYLARIVSDNLNIPMIDCLKKIHQTEDQIGLNHDERWENMQKCFKFIDKINIKNKRILIIDDVITTGATTFYCAYELIKNGAEEITVLTGAKSKV